MKLSIFTTGTDPIRRGDNYFDAMKCYGDLADELILVEGSSGALDISNIDGTYKTVLSEWPKAFSWEFIGQQFQRGYEACTGDWVIHADLDFIFHEKDFATLRTFLENCTAPAATFYKHQFILPDRYNLKSRLVLAVNKGSYGGRIRFDAGGDLCQPSVDGYFIEPSFVPEVKIPFYNYEKLTKTEAQIVDDVERMDDAYLKRFGRTLYSSDELTAYEGWLKMAVGRFSKPSQHVALSEHPKYVQETIKNLKPEQFGYDGLGHLERNAYAR